jgi:hypothetical protein
LANKGLGQEKGKFNYMFGWGLAVLDHMKGDKELGPEYSYLVLHKKSSKWSVWGGGILALPANVTANISAAAVANDTELNDTNATNATNASAAATPATPAAAPAAPAAPATPAAGAAAAGNSSNASNATNASNKTNKTKKKKLPEPYAGDDSDDDDARSIDLTVDIDNSEEFEDDEDATMKEKIEKASAMYELSGGFVHVKWLKWLKLFDTDTD